ncbi:MAG: lipoprotein insertase outer membrane protein LolB [Xanthomonadales bacterium]|nr:lipoprotein insertase outer membrane protein LolB [Xanthomonadales bacterium]
MSARLPWLALVLSLAGCAALPPEGGPETFRAPDQWQLSGRLALSNGRDGGSGELEWDHGLAVPGHDELRFHGALGRGSWRLKVTPDVAVLKTGDGQVQSAGDVSELVEHRTGWRIPVRALAHWVTGNPQPDVAHVPVDDSSSRSESFRQHDWLVTIEGYHQLGDRWLPRKIIARRDGDEVRLLIRSWQLPERG